MLAPSGFPQQVMLRVIADLDQGAPIHQGNYLNQLAQDARVDPIVLSLAKEALRNYRIRCFKATVVLMGTAAERIILGIRDVLVQQITRHERPIPKPLLACPITTVFDALTDAIRQIDQPMPLRLEEVFDGYWPALLDQVQVARQAAWHPRGIDTVPVETVHAALLLFPELAWLGSEVRDFVRQHYR
jgi:hypothetical protein